MTSETGWILKNIAFWYDNYFFVLQNCSSNVQMRFQGIFNSLKIIFCFLIPISNLLTILNRYNSGKCSLLEDIFSHIQTCITFKDLYTDRLWKNPCYTSYNLFLSVFLKLKVLRILMFFLYCIIRPVTKIGVYTFLNILHKLNTFF